MDLLLDTHVICNILCWASNFFGIILIIFLGGELSLGAFVEKFFRITDGQKQTGEV